MLVPERSTARNTCPANPSGFIDAARNYAAAEVDCSTWSKVGVTAPFFALVERMHQNWLPALPPPIKRLPFESTSSVPQYGRVGNIDRIHPGDPAVGGTAELPAAVIIAGGAPKLVLESVTRAVGLIYREPLLVASRRRPEAASRIGRR